MDHRKRAKWAYQGIIKQAAAAAADGACGERRVKCVHNVCNAGVAQYAEWAC
jgi:hypothetical protein